MKSYLTIRTSKIINRKVYGNEDNENEKNVQILI